jgi:hypothetical protein
MTEVQHGQNPTFRPQITGNGYELKIVTRPTGPEWTAGGAVDWKYNSAQAAKRMNELLGLRSIFLNWWFREWLAQGGSLQQGAEQWRAN